VLGTVDGLGTLDKLLLVIAITFGTINIVGGFFVTDRMLEMFKGQKAKQVEAAAEDSESK
ncbi:MAG: proton-translocating transhydrogenase family protein, partial [Solirubrobacteraceae bacterium]